MKIPILKLKGILLSSIQVDLTDHDALEFQEDVLAKIRGTDAKGLIIDITGLDIVDSYLARILNETAHMAQLLGTETVICGMHPSVALTLIEMGRELVGVESALNLDQAMDRVERKIARRMGAGSEDLE